MQEQGGKMQHFAAGIWGVTDSKVSGVVESWTNSYGCLASDPFNASTRTLFWRFPCQKQGFSGNLTESYRIWRDWDWPNGLSLSSGSILRQAGFGLFSVWTIRRPASTEAGGILQNAVQCEELLGAVNWNDPTPAQEKSTSMAKMSRVVLGNWPALESSPWAHNSLLACSCWG